VHPLPPDFDLGPIIGSQLTQICVDEFQIQLHFENGHIQGGGKVCLSSNGKIVELFHEQWKTCSGLEAVIGSQAVNWSTNGSHEFSIQFSSEATLVFAVQEGQYEDFTVQVGDGGLWVL